MSSFCSGTLSSRNHNRTWTAWNGHSGTGQSWMFCGLTRAGQVLWPDYLLCLVQHLDGFQVCRIVVLECPHCPFRNLVGLLDNIWFMSDTSLAP